MNATTSCSLLAGAALVLTGLTGCLKLKPASDPTHFYVLTARCETNAPLSASVTSTNTPLLMLGRVEVANYLQRSELTWRKSPNHVAFSHYDQWAEPLGASVERVLKENLLRLLGPERFFAGINPGDREAREIRIELLQFDLSLAGEARLEAHCLLVDHRTREPLRQRSIVATRSFDPHSEDHTVLAAALSETLADLARQVADFAQP